MGLLPGVIKRINELRENIKNCVHSTHLPLIKSFLFLVNFFKFGNRPNPVENSFEI